MKQKNTTTDLSLELPPIDPEILQQETRLEQQGRNFILFLIICAFSFALAVGSISYSYIRKNILEKGLDDLLSSSLSGIDESENENLYERVDKVAFISSGDIWFYDLKKKKETRVTSDGTSETIYKNPSWKNSNEITFSKCSLGKCSIQTYNISERKITENFNVEGDKIFSLRWSHKQEWIAYIFKQNNDLFLTIKSGDVFKNLGKFSFDPNRSFDFNDAIYSLFSPNDERIMLVNTFSQNEDPSIVILDLNGDIIASIPKEGDWPPSFGFFTSNDTIYYKKNDFLYVRSLNDEKETKLTDRIVGAFNFQPSPDKSKITYWTYNWPDGVTTIWVYEIGNDSMKRLRDQETYSSWIDNETLVSLHLPDCLKCPLNEFKYSWISKADLKTKVVEPLVEIDDIQYLSTESF